jgi:methyltransferase (TIGR00027 family)
VFAGRSSLVARRVAAQRARLAPTRPSTPTGDPDAERRLCADLRGTATVGLGRMAGLAERTRVVDAEVAGALGRGTRQVVLLGAGYDGRALRFGGGDTRWFEVDRPATLADKERRLRALGIEPTQVRFIPLDLLRADVGAALDAAGHDPDAPTLYVCEGLAEFLTLEAMASACDAMSARAAVGSRLVATFVVTPEVGGAWRARRAASDLLLRAAGEPRRNEFAPGDPEKLMVVTGWHVLYAASAPRPRPRRSRRVAAPPGRPTTLVLVCEPGHLGQPGQPGQLGQLGRPGEPGRAR